MKYPKQIMTIKELLPYGWKRRELMDIYRSRNQKVAWKCGRGGRTSTIKFDTEELEKYRRAHCTGV